MYIYISTEWLFSATIVEILLRYNSVLWFNFSFTFFFLLFRCCSSLLFSLCVLQLNTSKCSTIKCMCTLVNHRITTAITTTRTTNEWTNERTIKPQNSLNANVTILFYFSFIQVENRSPETKYRQYWMPLPAYTFTYNSQYFCSIPIQRGK